MVRTNGDVFGLIGYLAARGVRCFVSMKFRNDTWHHLSPIDKWITFDVYGYQGPLTKHAIDWKYKIELFCGGTHIGQQGLYSLCGNTSHRQISWSLDATRLHVVMIVSLWYLKSISAVQISALLERSKSEFRSFDTSRDLAVKHSSA